MGWYLGSKKRPASSLCEKVNCLAPLSVNVNSLHVAKSSKGYEARLCITRVFGLTLPRGESVCLNTSRFPTFPQGRRVALVGHVSSAGGSSCMGLLARPMLVEPTSIVLGDEHIGATVQKSFTLSVDESSC